MGALVSHIGGYGIPAIPTQPATAMFSHRFHRIHRSLLLRRNSHRFVGGYGIPAIPMHPVTVMFSHRFHGFTQMVRLRSGLPQNTQNSQKFITEKKLPQISRIYTLSLQKKAIRLNNQGKTMIAKDSFVPLL